MRQPATGQSAAGIKAAQNPCCMRRPAAFQPPMSGWLAPTARPILWPREIFRPGPCQGSGQRFAQGFLS